MRQRWQGEPPPRALAALRTAGDIRARQLPQPLGDTLDRTGGRIGWLVEQWAALAQGPSLASVGQETDMAHALQALGHDMQEKAADERMRLQRHGLHAVALASVAVGKAHLAVLHIDDAVVGDGHAVCVAAAAQFCDVPIGRRLRFSDGAGTPGAQGRQYDYGLHTCAAAWRTRGAQPTRSALSIMAHRP